MTFEIEVLLDTLDDLAFATDKVDYIEDMTIRREIDPVSRIQTIGQMEIIYYYREDDDIDQWIFGRWVQCNAVVGMTTHNLFTGIVESTERIDTVKARIIVQRRAHFFNFPIHYGLQIDQRADQIIESLLNSAGQNIRGALRDPVSGKLYWRVGVADSIGNVLVGDSTPVRTSYDVAKNTLDYFGDLEEQTARLDDAIRQVVLSEAGWWYEEGDGTLTFRNRGYSATLDSDDATVDQADIQFNYDITSAGVSKVIGRFIARDAESNALVYTLEDDWTIPRDGGIFRKFPIDPEGRTIGMYGDVTTGDITLTSGIRMVVTTDSNALVFEFANATGATGILSAGATFRCNALYQGALSEVEYVSSINVGAQVIELPPVWDDGENVNTHAQYILELYTGDREQVTEFIFVDEAEEQFSLDLLSTVAITLTTPSHDERYLVGGIDHWIEHGRWRTAIKLIPFLDDIYWIVGVTGRMEIGHIKVGY